MQAGRQVFERDLAWKQGCSLEYRPVGWVTKEGYIMDTPCDYYEILICVACVSEEIISVQSNV